MLFLGGLVKGIGRAAKGAVKGLVSSGGSPVGAITGAIGGIAGNPPSGGGGGPQVTQPGGGMSARRVARAPQFTSQPAGSPPDRPIISSSPMDFGPIQVDPGAALDRMRGSGGDGQATAQPPMMGGSGFGQALMAKMLQSKVRSSDGRAILEAMQAGSLEGGMIQQPTPVQTPRGQEMHSQPGFRTISLGGQKVSVFKPLAKALGLLKSTPKAKITAADMKTIRQSNSVTKKLKRLAKKTGDLKVTNK